MESMNSAGSTLLNQSSSRIALLIDSDNVSAVHLEGVLAELASYGTVSVRRMYGDWTSERLRGWKDAANEHSVQPIQQFSYTTGKNATDSALIIDAMDLLHQSTLDSFAIVSSDSDFTRLASRLRESGARVVGFGERKTPKPFVNACDTFIYLDVLRIDESGANDSTSTETTGEASRASSDARALGTPSRATVKELRQDSRLMILLRAAIAAGADDDGWAHLSGVGATVQKQSPDFDSRNWGYAKLGDRIDAVGLFEVDRFVEPNGNTNLRVRILKRR